MNRSHEANVVLTVGDGGRRVLREALDAGRVLLVASAATVARLWPDGQPPGRVVVFSAFAPNPTIEHAVAAAAARELHCADTVVGIGGGSAMDVAKAARVLPADRAAALDVVARRQTVASGPRLLLFPTSAGTGSEVTSFATLYVDGRKVSLDDDRVRADGAWIDVELIRTCPPGVLFSGVLDTISHAVESLWSLRATPASRRAAVEALRLVRPVVERPETATADGGLRALSLAGTSAGRAIDCTRTTAAHALAYPLTVRLGLRHGYACAVNLRWLIPHVSSATVDHFATPVGAEAPTRSVATAADALGVAGADGLVTAVEKLMRRCGPAGLPHDGISDAVVPVVDEGLASERLAGMPVPLERMWVCERLQQSLLSLPEPQSVTGGAV